MLLSLCLFQACVTSDLKPGLITNIATRARLVFDQGGFYQLSSGKLKETGLAIKNIEQIQLIYKGESCQYWYKANPKNEDFEIYFFVPIDGDRNLTQQIMVIQTDYLSSNQSLVSPLKLEEANFQKLDQVGIALEKIEQDLIYLPKASYEDPFLWTEIKKDEAFSFYYPINEIVRDSVDLQLSLWSPTSAPTIMDHAIRINNHGNHIGTYKWKGSGSQDLLVTIPIEDRNDSLDLEIYMENLDDVVAQLIYLDQIEISTRKELILEDSSYEIQGSGSYLNFGNALTGGFLVERDLIKTILTVKEIKKGEEVILNSKLGSNYDWVPFSEFKNELSITPLSNQAELIPEIAIDWLVIAPEKFKGTLEPLIIHRQNQDLSTFIVDPQQIYDQFSGGFPDSNAFRDYFLQLKADLGEPPKYVLLIGDYSYERMGYQDSFHYLPSVRIQNNLIGETVSDLPLMNLDKDQNPDLIIGRIPAQNIDQLENWIKKVISFESSLNFPPNREIIALSDGQEPHFAVAARSFLEGLQSSFATKVINIEKDQSDAYILINKLLQSQIFLFSYFGHGSIDTWGKDQILTKDQIGLLDQQEYFPIFVNMTCLTGYYIHPEQESLTEALLFEQNVGAAAVLAPTSLTTANNQSELITNLTNALQFETSLHLGDVLLNTWSGMDGSNPEIYEVMQTFGLFGDPAMLLFP